MDFDRNVSDFVFIVGHLQFCGAILSSKKPPNCPVVRSAAQLSPLASQDSVGTASGTAVSSQAPSHCLEAEPPAGSVGRLIPRPVQGSSEVCRQEGKMHSEPMAAQAAAHTGCVEVS